MLLLCFVSCDNSETNKNKKENNASSNNDNGYNGNNDEFINCTMSDFIDSLGDAYYINEYSDPDEVQSMAAQYQLDPSKYGATLGISATNKTTHCMVIIIECDSTSSASTLNSDCANIVEMLEKSYSSQYSFDSKCAGKYVLIGEVNAINDALKNANQNNSSNGGNSGNTNSTMLSFVSNLGDNYSIDTYTDLEYVQEMVTQYQIPLDVSKYNATMGVAATNKSTYCMVVIVECDSEASAALLKADSVVIVEYLENSYSSQYSFDSILVGKYVLIGEVSAINDALN